MSAYRIVTSTPSAAAAARIRSRNERARPVPRLNRPDTPGFSSSQDTAAQQSFTDTKSRRCSPSAMPSRCERNSVIASPAAMRRAVLATSERISPLWASLGPNTLKNFSPAHCGGACPSAARPTAQRSNRCFDHP